MKKIKKTVTKKSPTSFSKKLSDARKDYEKVFTEIAPFIPKVEVKEPSTEGRWQTSAGLSLY